jgi:hypothetical protein
MTAFEEYKIIKTEIEGDLTISEHSQYNHLNADTVIVEKGIRTRLYGVIHKKLIIRKEARVFLHGKLLGELQDEGGRFYHFEE